MARSPVYWLGLGAHGAAGGERIVDWWGYRFPVPEHSIGWLIGSLSQSYAVPVPEIWSVRSISVRGRRTRGAWHLSPEFPSARILLARPLRLGVVIHEFTHHLQHFLHRNHAKRVKHDYLFWMELGSLITDVSCWLHDYPGALSERFRRAIHDRKPVKVLRERGGR